MSKTNTQIVENGFFTCKLTVKDGEDLTISVRPDGFVNATQLCKAGKKRFNNWFQRNETKKLLHVLITNTGKTESQLIDVKVGGNHSGS